MGGELCSLKCRILCISMPMIGCFSCCSCFMKHDHGKAHGSKATARPMKYFIKQYKGDYSLNGNKGKYECEVTENVAVLKLNGGKPVCTFTCDPVDWPPQADGALPLDLDSTPHGDMRVVGICESEIIAEIQK